MNENEQDQLPEEYAFMKETVKDRPISARRVIAVLLIAALAALVFGLIAGYVIREMIPDTKPAAVSIGRDEPVTPTPAPTAAPTAAPTPTPTEAPTETPPPDPTEAPEESGPDNDGADPDGRTDADGADDAELTPEERAEINLTNYRELYAAMQMVAAKAEPGVVTVTGITSEVDWFHTVNESATTASGLIIAQTDADLMILTDTRAVTADGQIVITFCDGTTGEAALRKADQDTGLCVVSFARSQLSDTTAELVAPADLGNSYTLMKGQPVIAVGQPTGYTGAIDFGQITSTDHSVKLTDGAYPLLTTNIGSSAEGSGILLDLNGRVVGVIRQQFAPAGNTTVTAIPVSPLKALMEGLSNQQELPYLGVLGEDVTAGISEQTGMPRGVYVTSVDADSPVFAAGVQIADVIVSLNGEPVTGMSGFHTILSNLAPGSTAELIAARRGAEGYVEIPFEVTVGTR